VLPLAPPMSDEEFTAFQADMISPDRAALLDVLFEAPLETTVPVYRNASGFFVLEPPIQQEANLDGNVDQPVLDVVSPGQEAGSSSIERVPSDLSERSTRTEGSSESAAASTSGEVRTIVTFLLSSN